jgi:uncharacterized protein YlaI
MNTEVPECESCGRKDDLVYDVNPYTHELYGDTIKVYMCRNCRYEATRDI